MSETVQRVCPFCDEPHDSRGLYVHVMNSDDEEHGEHGSVPEGFEPREASIVTDDEEVIEANLESEYPNKLFMCHNCGDMSKGRRGHAIHLSKSAGDELHPEGASISDGNYTEIPADSDWEPMVDQSELAELHTEITSRIHEYELYQPDEDEDIPSPMKSDAMMSDEELQHHVENAVIPQSASKVEQVASLLNQVPELYDHAEKVKEIINCSTTTFYEGRKMYDNNASPEMETTSEDRVDRVDDMVWEAPEGDSVVIDGEPYVPLSAVKDIVRNVNTASEILNETGKEGTRLVMKNQ